MELEEPVITNRSSLEVAVDEHQRLHSLSPDKCHLSPQPPSIDTEISGHTVRFQPSHKYYNIDPIYTGRESEDEKQPNDYLLLSVLAFLFCMMFPTIFCAVLSIIYSFQVEIYWYLGRHERAHSASRSAKNWAVATFICGFAIILAVIFISTLWVVVPKYNIYAQ